MAQPALPLDASQDFSISARKRKLLQAMMAAAMADSPSTVNAGATIQANWGDALGKAFQAYMARNSSDRLDQEDADTARRVEGQRQSDVRGMFKPLEADIGPQGNDQGPLPAQMGLTPDLQSAQTAALSTNPELQKTGIAQAQEYAKQMAQLKAKNLEVQNNFHDGTFSRFDPGTNRMSTQITENHGPMVPATQTTPAYQVKEGTNEIKPMGGGQLLAPGSKFNQALGTNEVETLAKGRTDALSAINTLQNVANIETTLAQIPKGTLGSLAGLKATAAQFFGSAGVEIAQKYNTVEALHSALGGLLIEQIRAFAPVTKEDVDRMEKIVGSVKNTEAALNQIIEVASTRAMRTIQNHNDFAGGLSGKEGYGNLDHYKVNFEAKGKNIAPAGGVGGPQPKGNIPTYDKNGNRIN